MRKLKRMIGVLACVTITACASAPLPAAAPIALCPELPPPPEDVMVPPQLDWIETMGNFLLPTPKERKPSPSN